MDAGRLLYRLLQSYVLLLVAVSVGTVGWLLAPRVADSPSLAAVWFGAAGFGLLLVAALLFLEFGMR